MSVTLSKNESSQSDAGDQIKTFTARWTFGEDVAENFDAHVRKSVPLYESGHDLTVKLSEFFVKNNSTVYELGSSTGTLIRKIADRHKDLNETRFIGLEVEQSMVSFSKRIHSNVPNMFFQQAQAEEYEYEKCDFLTSYYTMQFIQPKFRQILFDKIQCD